jgi:CheY-specific phosphatase CheX
MKKEVLISAMKESISDVLGTMFFLPVDFDDSVSHEESWNLNKDEIIIAKLSFDGHLKGYCVFYIPEKLALSITADFMGRKKEDTSNDQVKETVKEITNMIVGNMFSLFNQEAVFNLGVPAMVDFDDFQNNLSGSKDKIYIAIQALEDRLAFQIILQNDK